MYRDGEVWLGGHMYMISVGSAGKCCLRVSFSDRSLKISPLYHRFSRAIMATEAKPADVYTEEARSSIEKDKTKLDLVPGADESQKAFYEEFASKDEEWRAHMDKKLLRKVDIRLLPILVVSYFRRWLEICD